MLNPDKKLFPDAKNENYARLSQELIDLKESMSDFETIKQNDYSGNRVLTQEMDEAILKERISKERLWNFFVSIAKETGFTPPQDRKTQILDIACSVCEEKEALHSFFGGESNPYYNDNDNAVVTGIDIDAEAIELANKALPRNREGNFKFIVGDASNLGGIEGVPQTADVVLIRHQQMVKPNYNKDNLIETGLWQKIINEGIDRLDEDGILIITSYTNDEQRALLGYLTSLGGRIGSISEGVNEFAEPFGGGGIDKYFAVIKLRKKS